MEFAVLPPGSCSTYKTEARGPNNRIGYKQHSDSRNLRRVVIGSVAEDPISSPMSIKPLRCKSYTSKVHGARTCPIGD